MKKLQLLTIGLLALACAKHSYAQETKGLLGAGLGYNNNMGDLSSICLNVVGEFPLKPGSSLYANFHWSLGWVQQGGLQLSSNLASVATFVLLSNDENNSYLAGEAAGILMLIPTGMTYYVKENDTSRTGIYVNPLSSDYLSFGENQNALTYAPEIGFKHLQYLHKKTYLYFSGGCAYSIAIKEGSSTHLPEQYDEGIFGKLCIGLVFYGTSEKKKSKPTGFIGNW